MKFIHAVVFDKDEYESIKSEGLDLTTDWGIVCDGDYVVHALYDCQKKAVLTLEDDTHNSVCAEIASFINGIKYCGNEVEVINAYVVVNDCYSYTQTCEAITNGEYVEVKD